MEKGNVMGHFTLWKTLRLAAIATLVFIIYSVVAEANALNEKIVWVKDKLLDLVWDAPLTGGSDHYRIEINKTNLLAEPVTTSLGYRYSENPQFAVDLKESHSYLFRVQAVTSYGALSDYSDSTSLYIYSGEQTAIEEEESAGDTPSEFSLSQNYPNPFNGTTTIEYQIPSSGMDGNNVRVRLEIYNMLGQRVKELVNEIKTPDKYKAIWDGRNDYGIPVASANYIYRLAAGSRVISKKMIFLK